MVAAEVLPCSRLVQAVQVYGMVTAGYLRPDWRCQRDMAGFYSGTIRYGHR